MDSDVKELLKRIAKSYSKEGSEYSFKIFSKEQLQKKSRLFQGMTLDFLIVKTKNGEAAKIAQFVGIKDERAITKGNPAAKYLYPAIGGGSTRAYDTLFTQYLRNRSLISRGDYPFAVMGSRYIKINSYGRVRKYIYSNTIIGLGKTRDKETKGRSKKNAKIQDGRVLSFKSQTGKFKAGIYREVSNKNGSFLSPLFLFKPIPTQRPKQRFTSIVGDIGDKLIFEMLIKEIKELAK